MTPEQLDEIEKMSEAATLGEWPEDEHWDGEDGFCAQGPYHTCPHGGHSTTRGTNDCNETLSNAALADQQFLQKVAEYALPLVKAVRAVTKERDEALAEAARLQAHVDWLLEGRAQQEQRLALEADE